MAIHEVHPAMLIARASKGDRQATLDLIKVDKLFLHDRCTEKDSQPHSLQWFKMVPSTNIFLLDKCRTMRHLNRERILYFSSGQAS